jgi:hypothetical protein
VIFFFSSSSIEKFPGFFFSETKMGFLNNSIIKMIFFFLFRSKSLFSHKDDAHNHRQITHKKEKNKNKMDVFREKAENEQKKK